MFSLEYQALWWLRITMSIPYAVFERSPRYSGGRPDVIGVTKAGFMVEIEIKRSMSDFRANAKKAHIANRQTWEERKDGVALRHYPKQFWFLVPAGMAEKVKAELPSWAGLLAPDADYQLRCLVRAPVNKFSDKLNTKEMLRLGRDLSNQILSQAATIETHNRNKDEPEYVPDDCMALLI